MIGTSCDGFNCVRWRVQEVDHFIGSIWGLAYSVYLCMRVYVCLDVLMLVLAYVAVPGRNRTLFCCIFRLRYRVRSAVVQYFR